MVSALDKADVPPLILDFICDVWEWGRGEGLFSLGDLYTWCLVSREWALRLRPLVFNDVTLRSKEHAEAFLALLEKSNTAGTRFAGCIETLAFKDQLMADAWFPSVYLSARSSLVNRRRVSLAVHRPLHKKRKPIPLSASLPAEYPISLAFFEHIYLENCHPPTFNDLLSFIGRTSDFGFLNCSRLSCEDLDTLAGGARPPQLAVAQRAAPSAIIVQRSNLRWPFIWLLLTTSQSHGQQRKRVRYINPEELPKVENLARCMLDSCGSKCPAHTLDLSERADGVESTTTLRLRCESPQTSPRLEITLSPVTGLVMNITLLFDHLSEGEGQLSLLITELEPKPLRFRWEDLDGCAATFGESMSELSIRVRTDKVHMHSFAEHIARRLPRVHSSGKLRFFYAEPSAGYAWDDDVIRDLWKFSWESLIS